MGLYISFYFVLPSRIYEKKGYWAILTTRNIYKDHSNLLPYYKRFSSFLFYHKYSYAKLECYIVLWCSKRVCKILNKHIDQVFSPLKKYLFTRRLDFPTELFSKRRWRSHHEALELISWKQDNVNAVHTYIFIRYLANDASLL